MHDVSNIWRVPLLMQSQDAHKTILQVLGLPQYSKQLDMHQWKVQIADRCAGALVLSQCILVFVALQSWLLLRALVEHVRVVGAHVSCSSHAVHG